MDDSLLMNNHLGRGLPSRNVWPSSQVVSSLGQGSHCPRPSLEVSQIKRRTASVHIPTDIPNKMFISTGVKGIGKRLEKLGYSSYREYLSSDHWQGFRNKFLSWFRNRNNGELFCEYCSAHDTILNVHHRTYKRLGAERIGDMVLLCRNCHEKVHKLKFSQNKKKLNLWQATKITRIIVRKSHSG